MLRATILAIAFGVFGCSALLDLDYDYEADADRSDAGADASADAAPDSTVDASSDATTDAGDVGPDAEDAGPLLALDMMGGEFTRDSRASYVPGDDRGELDWAEVDERRFEAVAGSPVSQLLLEGPGVNRAWVAALDLSAWDFDGASPDLDVPETAAPDGSMTTAGYRNQAGEPNRPRYLPGGVSSLFTVSIYSQRGDGSTNLLLRGPPRSSATLVLNAVLPGWTRLDATWGGPLIPPESLSRQIQVANHQDIGSPAAGITGDYHYWWGAQLEDGPFPTSFIEDESGRAPERLVFPEVEAAGLLGSFAFDIWPLFSSAEVPSDQAFVLLSLGGPDDMLRIRDGRLELWVNGMLAAVTEQRSFDRGTSLHIEVRQGVALEFEAAIGAWNTDRGQWAAGFGTARVGAVQSAALDSPYFGHISSLVPL